MLVPRLLNCGQPNFVDSANKLAGYIIKQADQVWG